MNTISPPVKPAAKQKKSISKTILQAHIPHADFQLRYEHGIPLRISWTIISDEAEAENDGLVLADYLPLTTAIDQASNNPMWAEMIRLNPDAFINHMLAATLSDAIADWFDDIVLGMIVDESVEHHYELKISIDDRYCAEYIEQSIINAAGRMLDDQAFNMICIPLDDLRVHLGRCQDNIKLRRSRTGFSVQDTQQITKALQYLSTQSNFEQETRVTSRLTKSGCDYLIHIKAKLFH